jgi:hypothetical protein
MKNTVKVRNEHAAALFARAGNAGAAIAVDTRPKTIPNKRKRNDRQTAKRMLRQGGAD